MDKHSTAIEQVYLGTWFQRTSLHLHELFDFINNRKNLSGFNEDDGIELLKKLDVKNISFFEGPRVDSIEIKTDKIITTITADGVILMKFELGKLDQAVSTLEDFYTNKLSPVLTFLFSSRGAPLPKELANIKSVYPHLLVGNNVSDAEATSIFEIYKEVPMSVTSKEGLKITSGNSIIIFSLLDGVNKLPIIFIEELLRNIIFFREFELQLQSYLNLHRIIWGEISKIREAGDFRYSDFPNIRKKILEFLKTLTFVKARMKQMEDILNARNSSIDLSIKDTLVNLGLNKFNRLTADQQYMVHLWDMTIEYTKGSLKLLESLYQENTQRELNTLKFITLIGVLTGFFGMNISFPWEERWTQTYPSSVIVVVIIVIICFSFYHLLKYLIYNRHFTVKK